VHRVGRSDARGLHAVGEVAVRIRPSPESDMAFFARNTASPMQGYNFTERVRRILALAREEAGQLRHEYVGTEHILLGLLREGKGIAAQVLVDSGASLDRARAETLRLLDSGDAPRAEVEQAAPSRPSVIATAIPSAGARAQEELAWARLTHALDATAKLG